MILQDLFKARYTTKLILIGIIFTCIFLGNNWLQPIKYASSTLQKEETINVDRFDLTKPLLPQKEYEKIQCRNSANVLNVAFEFLCVHDSNNDFVSKAILEKGIWEESHVAQYIGYLLKNPNMLAIDIGAQLGTFSLYAAAAGAKVLAVEPFYDNIIRIHKSALSSNLQNQIVLITNALSDKRNDIKKLNVDKINIGGQQLRPNEESYNLPFDDLRKLEDGKYYVRTVLLDDLVPYMPLNKYNKNYKSAIMKIDIEGFEPYAFQNASKLFNTFDIEVIIMEWGIMNYWYQQRKRQTDDLLKFLYYRGYNAYHADTNELLNKNAISSWPFDIYWKKT